MIDLLVFLQNPWTRTPAHHGKVWDDEVWEEAMWKSRSGTRLQQLLLPTWIVAVRNCNPIPTYNSRGLRRPDPVYVKEQVKLHAPKVMLLCGIQAFKVGEMGFGIPFVTMPHPAHRLLTNVKLKMIQEQIASCLRSVITPKETS